MGAGGRGKQRRNCTFRSYRRTQRPEQRREAEQGQTPDIRPCPPPAQRQRKAQNPAAEIRRQDQKEAEMRSPKDRPAQQRDREQPGELTHRQAVRQHIRGRPGGSGGVGRRQQQGEKKHRKRQRARRQRGVADGSLGRKVGGRVQQAAPVQLASGAVQPGRIPLRVQVQRNVHQIGISLRPQVSPVDPHVRFFIRVQQ